MKEITCIACPNGCRIFCKKNGDDYVFSGNRCHRGADYAFAEVTAPTRMLCTTVRTSFPDVPALPVRTSVPVPKERLSDIIHALSNVCVDRRIALGEVIVHNILGLESDILCTSTILTDTERFF